MSPLRVLVLMGGRSSEHEVSLSSAEGVLAALDPARYLAIAVVIGRDGVWTRDGRPVALCPGPGGRALLVDLVGGAAHEPVDVVFPVLHGPHGEDGTVQGLCEVAGVPYVGAGVAASAIAMDKVLFKSLALGRDLPVAEAVAVSIADWEEQPDAVLAEVARTLGYPCFVKPARLGSSVGISRVTGPEGLGEAIALAHTHDERALVEQGITGQEVEVGLLGDERSLVVSPPGRIVYEGDWYDYETKYQAGRARLVVPAPLETAVAERARELAVEAFRMVDCHGLARVDFFVTEFGEVLVSELNTMPGFTPTSAYPSLMQAAGVPYPEVVARLVGLALSRSDRARTFRL